MVLLNCSIIGEGTVIPVVIEESITVGLLKEAIAAKLNAKRADRLQLFLAKTAASTWLDWGGAAAVTLNGDGKLQGFEEMNPTLLLKNKKIFGENFQLGEGQDHVLVVPPKVTATNLATEELPVVKRARTEVTFAYDELVAITTIAQKLNPATDLAVGKLLKGPFSVLGTNLFGGLYVRQEYWDLYKLIKQQIQEAGTRKKLRRVLVIGSPGIGK
ncbi:hypothetical protein PF010_g1642 [Phytophthora fragariae]|uniref:Crinkler effector protein N-terminal domain-containing protein n=1 Tax=Phytophthora fragariae TaxID=53985 RepID=A0A6A4EUL2_9STRA|nr:hypothetical protein PF003_g8194 [Phytophthora fragariae]KAE8948086.1 hypothetical protein PF009_g2332 [Phytophthora fragariae]KAE9028642.1 hypothetical protein PF011_g1456 [Phytophthora fragariae]KAE9136550.1 hypothetical protein PF010_g1642 [Phytophthora fragariae]KAE9136571.1 hypothetical protein PF007_g2139 [Phytophthora fragariae]